MTRDELVADVRRRLDDEARVGWPEDSELLVFLDQATKVYSDHLIANKDISRIKRVEAIGDMDIPGDFSSFCGQVPFVVHDGKFEFYGDLYPMEIQYWAYLPYPSEYEATEELPYGHGDCLIIAATAAIFCQNQNEYDVTQDTMLLQVLRGEKAAPAGGAA